MASGKAVVLVCALVITIIQPHGCVKEASADKSSSNACPPGKVCPREKCLVNPDGSEKCCSCTEWGPNGMCKQSAWKGAGDGDACELGSHPNTDINMSNCPSGTVCQLSKCKGKGKAETCCSCLVWKEDGTCREDSWSRIRGNGDCSVVPGDGSSYIIGQNTHQESTGEGQNNVAEAPKTPPAKAETSTTTHNGTNQKEGTSVQPASAKGDEQKEKKVKLHGPQDKAETPSKSTKFVEYVVSHCPAGKTCEEQKCKGKGDAKTCCECNSWNSEGKCLPGEWKVLSGEGTCDFIMTEEAPAVAVPQSGDAHPNQYVDALPFTPCPAGVTCETTKCAMADGVERCCDCYVWKPTGLCTEKGWKPRGNGDCAFALRDSTNA